MPVHTTTTATLSAAALSLRTNVPQRGGSKRFHLGQQWSSSSNSNSNGWIRCSRSRPTPFGVSVSLPFAALGGGSRLARMLLGGCGAYAALLTIHTWGGTKPTAMVRACRPDMTERRGGVERK
uniref:Uncharacterized protein n=1 Tax=Anopheles melas TaxID=34690 RepID=A0A182U8A3_9DIPT